MYRVHWKYQNLGIRVKSMVNLILRLYTQYWVTNASMYKYNSMYWYLYNTTVVMSVHNSNMLYTNTRTCIINHTFGY